MRNIGNFHVTITKAELLAALRKNLSTHREECSLAMQGYTNLCVKRLRRRAREIKAGLAGDVRSWLHFDMSPPTSHERDYQQLIDMLDMAQETEFEIDGTQFRQWVKDEWDWKDNFSTMNQLYVAHS